MIDEKEIRLATEHPRGTELRRLGPYREALRSAEAYARLPPADRDAIVRWAETRRIVRERTGLDHDPRNLADPLLPVDRLRSHVIEGERLAAGAPAFEDGGGDLIAAVARLRGGRERHQPTA
ncbi:MAG: hypothetical protein FJ028_07900 [Chloroflexi bacterium]|nr:hypothetical protein [Chloroflexota bacterium]